MTTATNAPDGSARVGLVTHAACAEHRMHAGHPERPARLTHVLASLEDSGLADRTVRVEATPASRADLERAHPGAYLDFLSELAPRGADELVAVDPDTALCGRSLQAAGLATGAVLDGLRAVLNGDLARAFCAIRPPGHHAETDTAMGFCLYNSIAVAARAALKYPGIERVAVFDFDVHHGNGTVDIFKDQPEVLVCSSFQHPYYPNRYFDIERNNIVNTPLAAGTGSSAFRHAIEADWLPAARRHESDLILVSAGFDAHRDDPLAGLLLTEDDFAWVTDLLLWIAADHAGGRLVSALEGGYDLNALAASVNAHVTRLLDYE